MVTLSKRVQISAFSLWGSICTDEDSKVGKRVQNRNKSMLGLKSWINSSSQLMIESNVVCPEGPYNMHVFVNLLHISNVVIHYLFHSTLCWWHIGFNTKSGSISLFFHGMFYISLSNQWHIAISIGLDCNKVFWFTAGSAGCWMVI